MNEMRTTELKFRHGMWLSLGMLLTSVFAVAAATRYLMGPDARV